MKTIDIIATGLLLGVCFTASSSTAAIPPTINYQGQLTKADGTPIDPGILVAKVSLYNAPMKGSNVWGPQTFTNVAIMAGRFNLIIGPRDDSGVALDGAFAGSGRYLEVSVSGNPPILPRQQVLSAPFALFAGNDVPVGGIVAWVPPVALDSLTMELAKRLVPAGFLICDGAKPEDDLKTIFDERKIPDLTDGRFLRGDAVAGLGTFGGGSSHQHSFFPMNEFGRTGKSDHNSSERNDATEVVAGGSHTHQYNVTTDATTSLPRHCSVLFIIRVN